jgi:hypothetical protein
VMAVPRPVLLVLLGLALCAAAFLATRGARDPGGAVTAAPAPAPAQPAGKPSEPAAKPAEPKAADPAPAKPRAEKAAPAEKPAPAEKTAPAKPQSANPAAKAFGTQAAAAAKLAVVKAAVERNDAIVFFFTHPGATDDTGTRQAVKALHGMDHVTVVRAGLNELTTYRPVLAGVGVSQVPAVVVARADKPARLLEGYVDGRSLRQTVADALR